MYTDRGGGSASDRATPDATLAARRPTAAVAGEATTLTSPTTRHHARRRARRAPERGSLITEVEPGARKTDISPPEETCERPAVVARACPGCVLEPGSAASSGCASERADRFSGGVLDPARDYPR